MGFTELFIIKVEQVGFYRVIYNKGGTSGVLQSYL